jgi:MFS family permease
MTEAAVPAATAAQRNPDAAPDPRAVRAGFRPVWLDALNFLLADVRGALGPYLNVFLVTQRHWSLSEVGLMTTVSGLIGLAAQTPAGAIIDATNAKRGVIVISLALLAAGAVVIFLDPSFWPVMIANSALAVVGDVFGPAVAALTLGLYLKRALPKRMGRNAAFDHAGNVAIAVVLGGVGWMFGQRAVFLSVPAFVALAAFATLAIPDAAIDHGRARGSAEEGETSGGWAMVLRNRPLIAFAASLMLFHFANAPLLPLVGQKIALSHPHWATAATSACIVAAQLVMLPVAILCGRKAGVWGRRPILLAGFAVLPVRAALYTLSDDPAWLIGVQLLDGIGAGVLSVMTPLVVADFTRGAGRYNFALGAATTAQGIGASLSGLATGVIVDRLGYSAAFLECASAATVALAALWLLVPESAEPDA